MTQSVTGLVGDVGGTNARFALAHVEGGEIRLEAPASFKAADYPAGIDAVRAFLDQAGERPQLAVIAAAGPIENGAVEFTNNLGWRFSEAELRRACGFSAARLINDFTAQALAIDHFRPADLHRIGPDVQAAPRATAVILGPGTGFGAGARVDDGTARAIVTGEGGHSGFAPGDEVELDIVRLLMKKFGRVSVERLVSGPGLLNLYQALAELQGEAAVCERPDQVTAEALAGTPLAKAALDRFCAILGSVAGDFALAIGARGGVYVAGGIAPGILPTLGASAFRARFESKGRMSDYLKPIPTHVVTAPHAALIGSASQLSALEASA